jgi:hypothetical protein
MVSFLVCEKMLFTVQFGISNLERPALALKAFGAVWRGKKGE